MKILFLIHGFPGYGGVETVTTVLANHFAYLGYGVGIISFTHENKELLDKLNTGIALYHFPDQQTVVSEANRDFLLNTINVFQPDALINQESYSRLFELIVQIKDKLTCKIITVEHNSPDARYKMFVNYLKNEKFEFKPKIILKKVFRPVLLWSRYNKEKKNHCLLYEYSDDYILLSNKFTPIFMKLTGLKTTGKLKAIENPVTIHRQPVQLKDKEKIVLFVGRLDYWQKRVDRLIKIWEKISPHVPEWKLLIVGDGSDRPALERYIREHHISNIAFEGVQSGIVKYYLQASILCLTSNVEGWPLVLAEAMTMGCVPMLYNSFASAPDIVDDGINGILIRPFDKEMYENALLQLMLQNEDRASMAQQAMLDSNRFNLENIGSKWQELLVS